jgi:uncharacterized protein YukJ
MAGLNKYQVLVGRPISHKFGAGANGHFQVRVIDDNDDYRLAINVKSSESPSELLYYINDDFKHTLLTELVKLPRGVHAVEKKPGGIALDFIRGNLFERSQMRILAGDIAGPDNDLNEEINRYIQRAITDEEALIYAFGQRWGPEDKKDQYFGFKPGNGIHDIHMNQGNVAKYAGDDGVWQDGGILIHTPSNGLWTGIFMAFQSQAWHTDDTTGHTIAGVPPPPPPPGTEAAVVRVIAALVNPQGNDQGSETVTLLNLSDQAVDLKGWAIANKVKQKYALSGKIDAGAAFVVKMPVNVPLSNDGGLITLLNAKDLKVHGVQYTKQQADKQGWTLVFN